MAKTCRPEEVALKSFFLGPQSENGDFFREQVMALVDYHLAWRRKLFAQDGKAISSDDLNTPQYRQQQSKLIRLMSELLMQLESETPTFTPRYIGHMVSEVSVPALLGQFITLLHNPNNASKEVSRVGLRLEREAISALLKLMGFDPHQGGGHFTSGGTIANVEGLWRARYRLDHFQSLALELKRRNVASLDPMSLSHLGWSEFSRLVKKHKLQEKDLRRFSFVANNPWEVSRAWEKYFGIPYSGPVILVPANKHYSWQKGISLMGLGHEAFKSVALDKFGRLDISDLKKNIDSFRKQSRPILAVVSVAGTTEMGEVDPIDKVQDLLDDYQSKEGLHFWHHVDAAYGGFYLTCQRSPLLSAKTRRSLKGISRVDSVTIDPHKLGYVPYACGAILLPHQENDRVSSFDAPYLSSPAEKNAGWSATLEGSRSAAGPIAMWLSAKSIGLNPEGYGGILQKGLEAREAMIRALESKIKNLKVIRPADLNVVCFLIPKAKEKLSLTNQRTEKLFEQISTGEDFGVSRTRLQLKDYDQMIRSQVASWRGAIDDSSLFLIRLTLMNPFIVSKETKTDYIDSFAHKVKELLSHH